MTEQPNVSPTGETPKDLTRAEWYALVYRVVELERLTYLLCDTIAIAVFGAVALAGWWFVNS